MDLEDVHKIAEFKAGTIVFECYHMGTAEELARKFAPPCWRENI